MENFEVIKMFRDLHTQDLNQVGDKIKLSKERAEKLAELGFVKEAVPEVPTEKEDKTTKSTKEDKTVIQTK